MVNGRFLHLVVLLVNPLTPWSIHDSPLKNTELFLHWPLVRASIHVTSANLLIQFIIGKIIRNAAILFWHISC